MSAADIAEKIAAARAWLTDHPAERRYRDSPATARVESGLRVRVSGPDGAVVTTDMVGAVGGGGSGPSPAWLLRAGYASCVATLITMRAAEAGIELGDLEVTVDSESDDGGILGIDEAVPTGPLSMRVGIRALAGGTDETAVREVIAWGVAHCPVDDAVRRAVPVEVEVVVG